MPKTLRRIVCMSLLCLSMSLQGIAQVNTASLTGLVTDASGAAVAGASVKAKNNSTNVEQTVNTASLTGLVTDASGAAVAGASVKEKNNSTNVEQTVTTDNSGYYPFASLSVGRYTVTVESQGFKKAVRSDVSLEVGLFF